MIIRKPYAFFIKMFKPIHLILATLIVYLLILENKILSFFNQYISSFDTSISDNIKEQLGSKMLFVIPIIIIALSLIILGIMFKKQKPTTFYLLTIFSFIVVFVINLYAFNFLGMIEKTIVAAKSVKLIHDLVLINLIIESIFCIFFIVRGLGINIKKFDFNSDISKIKIEESDREEIELNVNVDLSENKRKRNRRFRYLKYTYYENKFIFNCVICAIIFLIVILSFLIINKVNSSKKENVFYTTSTFNYIVDKTNIIDTDYNDNKITDNYLIVVSTRIKTNLYNNSLFLNDFSLKIEKAIFKPTTKYSDLLMDIGTLYLGENLSNEYKNYIFVFEIPKKFKASNMYFRYADKNNIFNIKLKPKNIKSKKIFKESSIGEKINLKDILGDIDVKIDNYEISNRFALDYNYCARVNDCIISKEYLTPSADRNYDKVILKLEYEYENKSSLDLETFYKFFSKFADIYYQFDDTWHVQSDDFEEIKISRASKDNMTAYIGVKSEIALASSIKLVFNVRGSRYEYILK